MSEDDSITTIPNRPIKAKRQGWSCWYDSSECIYESNNAWMPGGQTNVKFRILTTVYQRRLILLQWMKVWKTSSTWNLQNEQMLEEIWITPKYTKRPLRESLLQKSSQMNGFTLRRTGICHISLLRNNHGNIRNKLMYQQLAREPPRGYIFPNNSISAILLQENIVNSTHEVIPNLHFPIQKLSSKRNIPLPNTMHPSPNWATDPCLFTEKA